MAKLHNVRLTGKLSKQAKLMEFLDGYPGVQSRTPYNSSISPKRGTVCIPNTCIGNCGQTASVSGMVGSLFINALSNGRSTIADHLHLQPPVLPTCVSRPPKFAWHITAKYSVIITVNRLET